MFSYSILQSAFFLSTVLIFEFILRNHKLIFQKTFSLILTKSNYHKKIQKSL